MDEMIVQSYRILELPPGASKSAIEKSYSDLSKVWDSDRLVDHPDLQQKAWDKLRELRWAYETLVRHMDQATASGQVSDHVFNQEQRNNVQALPVTKNGTYAGFWIRVVAAIIDTIVAGTVCYLVSSIWGFGIGLTGGSGSQIVFTDFILNIVINWLYCALMESSTNQATLGKMALGLIVTDLSGERISFGRATGRYFAKFISAFALCIGYLMVAFTENKQGLHDKVADTLVIRK
jgi:uncharacterized RDD family membrane protein YckC